MRRGDAARGAERSEGAEGRTERVELRLRAEEKGVLQTAAGIGGEDVSSFLRRAGLTEARRLLGTLKAE